MEHASVSDSAKKTSLFVLLFLSFWLSIWSVGVGLLSSVLLSSGGVLWLFIVTHGGAEIGAAWVISSSFLTAARQTVGGPEVTLDLAKMTASWGPKPRLHVVTVWFIALGLLVGAILGLGTWLPFFNAPTAVSFTLAVMLSAAWSMIGWRWLTVLGDMRKLARSVTVEATIDHVTIVQNRGVSQRETEIPAASLTVAVDGSQLTLSGPDASLTLHCGQTPARDQMVSTLQEMAARAAASPFEQPPLPQALASLRDTPEGQG